MTVTHKPVTAEELLRMPGDGVRRKRLAGEVRDTNPAGYLHGRIARSVPVLLDQYVRKHSLGVAFAAETGFKISSSPDTASTPDVAFVRCERVEEVGAHAVVMVEPRTKTVTVRSSRTEIRIVTEGDVSDAVPGWTVPVNDILE